MGQGAASPRRERILAAAEKEFARHGSAGARVERIAAAAGVNKQLLFHYFGSKAGLLQAVTSTISHRLDPSITQGRTPKERLHALVELLLLAADEYHELLPEEWRARAAECAAQIIQDGQGQGYFRDDLDPIALSDLVAAMAFGWTSLAAGAGNGSASEHRSSFGALAATVVSDYCSWR